MASREWTEESSKTPELRRRESAEEGRSFNYRHATVYDAVAGRISVTGFIQKHITTSSMRDTASSSITPLSPEAVLFRSKRAPTRYAEHDIYFANERVPDLNLPDSDLLKALHCYASDFYARATPDGGVTDWKSLDETALIAFGILMEEACKEILGESGDLVFTEGQEVERHPRKHSSGRKVHRQRDAGSEGASSPERIKETKRRRLHDG